MLEGDAEGAVDWLELGVARGFVFREMRVDPIFDAIREDPGFRAVLKASDELAATLRMTLTGGG